MSIIQRKMLVEESVHVMRCDAPNCNAETVVQYNDDTHVPEGWKYVRQSYSYHMNQERDGIDKLGPFHFHSTKCLLVWAQHVLEHEEEVERASG